jgi:hypothetical protein
MLLVGLSEVLRSAVVNLFGVRLGMSRRRAEHGSEKLPERCEGKRDVSCNSVG